MKGDALNRLPDTKGIHTNSHMTAHEAHNKHRGMTHKCKWHRIIERKTDQEGHTSPFESVILLSPQVWKGSTSKMEGNLLFAWHDIEGGGQRVTSPKYKEGTDEIDNVRTIHKTSGACVHEPVYECLDDLSLHHLYWCWGGREGIQSNVHIHMFGSEADKRFGGNKEGRGETTRTQAFRAFRERGITRTWRRIWISLSCNDCLCESHHRLSRKWCN